MRNSPRACSDDSEVELRAGGRELSVALEEAGDYLQALLTSRLHENSTTFRAMREGKRTQRLWEADQKRLDLMCF
jgi:hypothetical protein